MITAPKETFVRLTYQSQILNLKQFPGKDMAGTLVSRSRQRQRKERRCSLSKGGPAEFALYVRVAVTFDKVHMAIFSCL